MPLDIIRIKDRIKLDNKEIEAIVRDYVAKETGRQVAAVEFHIGRNELGASTVYFEFED